MSDGYLEGVVGESFFRDAVRGCRVGMPAEIEHHPDNPHSSRALAVIVGGRQIGHIGRDSWIQRAWHDEGKRFGARVHAVNRGARDTGIVLKVWIGEAAREARPPVVDRTDAPTRPTLMRFARQLLENLFGSR